MRNWHKKLIRTFTTSQNSGLNSDSSTNIVIGLIDDGYLEFKKVNETYTNTLLEMREYTIPHKSFGNLSEAAVTRVFFRGPENEMNYSQRLRIGDVYVRSHGIGASGIIVGKEINNSLIEGIVPNSTLIYAYNNQDVFILSGTNSYTSQNITSNYFKNEINDRKLANKAETLIPANPLVSDAYSNLKTDIISLSYNPDIANVSSKYVKFMLEELFSYGRNGRGTILINSAGNGETKETSTGATNIGVRMTRFNVTLMNSEKTIIVGASNFNTTDFDIHPANYDIISNINLNNEIHSEYSNYGDRLDLCAPSSLSATPKIDSLGIYTPTIAFGGEIGNPEDYIEKSVSTIRNSPDYATSKTVILKLNNTNFVFSGQAIELGNINSFGHEIRFIKEVNYETNEIKIDDRFYTRNISINKIRILLHKKKVHKSTDVGDINILINESEEKRKGMKLGQDVYIYAENSLTPTGEYSKKKKTKISSFIGTNKIKVEGSLEIFNQTDDLFLVLGQIKTIVKSKGVGYYRYTDIEGFFEGQLIYIKEKKSITNLTKINTDKNEIFTIIIRNIEKDEEVTFESLSYGHYTSRFGGTSAAAPIVSGVAALVLSANPQLNAAEVKHILKVTADKIGGVNYTKSESIRDYNFQYFTHEYFGTGRVNAEKAIQLAKEWHKTAPAILVEKPRMIFLGDATNPAISIEGAGVNGSFNANRDQNIKIKIKNVGNRYSFRETDLRVLIAITSTDEDRKFKFPDCWHENSKTEIIDGKDILIYKYALIDVQEISPIDKNEEHTATVELKRNAELFKNYISSRHRVFILAHIAPFDGTNSDLAGYTSQNTEFNNSSLVFDITNNKNLAAVEIIPIDTRVSKRLEDGTKVPLNGDKSNLIATDVEKHEKFCVDMYNVQATELDTKQFKFSLLEKPNGAVESEVIIKKTNGNWDLSNLPDWLTADIVETDSALYAATHKNAEINYALSYDLTKAGKQIQFAVI